MPPSRKAPAAKANAAPAAAEAPPAKKAKGGPKPGSGAPTKLQQATTSSGIRTIASMLGCREEWRAQSKRGRYEGRQWSAEALESLLDSDGLNVSEAVS